ncbi:hypothetical protein D3C80_1603470 [compost metagenome]
MVGDVEEQGQLRRTWGGIVQGDGQATVVDAVGLLGGQSGGLGCVRQRQAAVEPGCTVAAADAQGQVGLVAEFGE